MSKIDNRNLMTEAHSPLICPKEYRYRKKASNPGLEFITNQVKGHSLILEAGDNLLFIENKRHLI